MEGHAKKCVERHCELANTTTEELFKVATPCMDDHQVKQEEMGSVGELSTVCSQIVLKCPDLARIGRPGILWSVNKLARAVTKWTKACDKRSASLISYIHHTFEFRQYDYVGNTAQHCRWGLFQVSDFAGDLANSKSTSRGILCIFGSRTFVPRSWMCKKQTSVSHSSTEAEIISLDGGLRMDGIPALTLWDSWLKYFDSSPNQTNKTKDVREPRGNLSATRIKNAQQIPTTNTNLLQIRQIPWSTIVFGVENSIQNSSHSLFWFSICDGKGSPRYSNPKYARNGRNEESSRTTSWRSLSAKIEENHETIQKLILSCRKCKNRWILWKIQENFKKWNQITVGDHLAFPVSLQWFQVLVPCRAATNACLLTHGIHRDHRKRFWWSILYVWFTPRSSSRNSPLRTTKRTRISSTSYRVGDSFRKRWQTELRHNSNADIFRKAVDYEFVNAGGISAEFYGWTVTTANIGTAIRQIPWSPIIFGLEDTIHKSGDHLFWFSIGCRGIQIRAIRLWKEFSKLWDTGRENCFCCEQDHPEFSLQEEGQSRRTESPKRGSVSSRKTNRLHDPRLLSSYWRSWYSIGFCRFILCHSSWR